MKEWIDQVYPIFESYCQNGITVENIDKELVGEIIPEEETVPAYLLKHFSNGSAGGCFLAVPLPRGIKPILLILSGSYEKFE